MKLWQGSGQQPAPVDFANELVLLVGTRVFTGTGPHIAIDSVRLSGRHLIAYVRTGSCDGPSFGGHLMTRPMFAIAVREAYTQVRFMESYETFPGCFSERPDTTA